MAETNKKMKRMSLHRCHYSHSDCDDGDDDYYDAVADGDDDVVADYCYYDDAVDAVAVDSA